MKLVDLREKMRGLQVGPVARLLYVVLWTYQQDDAFCYPANRELCAVTGFSERKLQRALEELDAAGLVRVKVETGKYGAKRELAVVEPPAPSLVTPPPSPVSPPPVTGDTTPPSLVSGSRASIRGREDTCEDTLKEGGGSFVQTKPVESERLKSNRTSQPPPVASGSPAKQLSEAEFSGEYVSETDGLPDVLGKTRADWIRLFNRLCEVFRSKVTFGFQMGADVGLSFRLLVRKMRENKWWPTRKELEQVEWRYAQKHVWAPDGCQGGHHRKASLATFIRDLPQWVLECQTEWEWAHGKGADLFRAAEPAVPLPWDGVPMEEWEASWILLACEDGLIGRPERDRLLLQLQEAYPAKVDFKV